jgi:hypothetical protein
MPKGRGKRALIGAETSALNDSNDGDYLQEVRPKKISSGGDPLHVSPYSSRTPEYRYGKVPQAGG